MINPIVEVFNVPDGTGLNLSDYALVWTTSGFWTNPPAWFCGTFLAGGIYYLIVMLFAPITWMLDFVTNPDQIASILTSIGGNLADSAFKIAPPLALGTLALMLLAFRLIVAPRWVGPDAKASPKGVGGSSSVRFLGKTGFNYDSTIMRGHWKDDPERKKAVEQLTAGFVLLIVVAVFTMKPFLVLKKILEFQQAIVADITSQQGAVAAPMFGVLRGLTWIINFGGAIPENCISAWSESMTSGDPDAIENCLPADQVGNMTPGVLTIILAALSLPVVWALLKFAWPFLKNATWFLAVVIWKCIYIPYIALRTLIQPDSHRGILDDLLSIFRVIVTYCVYFLAIVFLAALLPSALLGALQGLNVHPLLQIGAVGLAYYFVGTYVIGNIRPGGQLFGTTMVGEAVKYDGWGGWREQYWENPNERPAQIFQQAGIDGLVLSPAWSKARRERKKTGVAAEAGQKAGSDVLSEADKKTVRDASERTTVGAPAGGRTATARAVVFGDGVHEKAVTTMAKLHDTTSPSGARAADGTARVTQGGANSFAISTNKAGAPSPAPATAVAPTAAAVDGAGVGVSPPPATPNGRPPAAGVGAAAERAPAFGAVDNGHTGTASDTGRHRRNGTAPSSDSTQAIGGENMFADEIIVLGQAVRIASASPYARPEPGRPVPRVIDGEVVESDELHRDDTALPPIHRPPESLRERQDALLRNLFAATRGVSTDDVEFAASGPVLRPQRQLGAGASSAYTAAPAANLRGAEKFDGAKNSGPLGYDPLTGYSTPATAGPADQPGRAITANAAAERAHSSALLRAQARGQAIAAELSPAMESRQEFFFDPREPGGLWFERKSGFNDRI